MFGRDREPASIPPGVRVYAIGDIHGRLDLLTQLLAMIGEAEQARPAERALMVFLGDYVDRGPDSRGVIELLMTGLPPRFETFFLRGNHEEMMLRALASPDHFDIWAANGGLATARSYGVEADPGAPIRHQDAARIRRELVEAVPEAHRDFMRALPVRLEAGGYLFVHAGVRPGVPMDAQNDWDCMTIRREFLDYRGDFGRIVVHGHTPGEEPDVQSNRIGIDTGAFFTDRLTALCLEERSRAFFSTGGSPATARA